MCGRYFLLVKLEKLVNEYEIKNTDIDYQPPGEIFPTQKAPVIFEDEKSKRKLARFKWGFTPPFTNNPIINARAETLEEKSLFKASFKEKRCLIPANLFYEWKDTAANKVKYEIGLKNRDIMSLAGLYDTFEAKNGSEINCFTIVTTTPSTSISNIHSRMPVILTEKGEKKWIDTANNDQEMLKNMLRPYSDDKIKIKKANKNQQMQLHLPFKKK